MVVMKVKSRSKYSITTAVYRQMPGMFVTTSDREYCQGCICALLLVVNVSLLYYMPDLGIGSLLSELGWRKKRLFVYTDTAAVLACCSCIMCRVKTFTGAKPCCSHHNQPTFRHFLVRAVSPKG